MAVQTGFGDHDSITPVHSRNTTQVPEPPRRRTVLLLVSVLAVLTAVLLIVFVLRLSRQEGAKVNLGDQEFVLGRDTEFAPRIAKFGPLIFAPLRGALTIYVQHLGPDPAKGWLAFSAVAPAAAPAGSKRCVVRRRPPTHDFVDCTGTTYPDDGTGLDQYATRVEPSGQVIINLREPVGRTPPTGPA